MKDEINPLAKELNDTLKDTIIYECFSDFGKRIYFPKGIIAQGNEAKKTATVANATIGMALQNGVPEVLSAIQNCVPDLRPQEIVTYAPTAGILELRDIWKQKLFEKNPALKGKDFSLPVVVPGLTSAICYTCELFLEKGQTLLAARPSWDNYDLIVSTRVNATLKLFNMLGQNGLDMQQIKKAIKEQAKTGRVNIILNFPQNPSGYSPTKSEALELCAVIKEAADGGAKVLVICDDAYFGLEYEGNVETHSLFAYLADISPNVLVAKIDGPTKEDFAWGFRIGFLTFAAKGLTQEHYQALIKKIMGAIRCSVSCSNTIAQSLLLRAFKDAGLEAQKKALRDTLEERYKLVKSYVATHTSPTLKPLPFNSGYFMSFAVLKGDAYDLQQRILQQKKIGTVAIDKKTLRVAFSSIDAKKIDTVYDAIYEVSKNL